MRFPLLLVFWLLATPALAQESKLQAEFRREAERLAQNCGKFELKALLGCATTLVTDKPLHIALGNIAPGNGFGIGAAFVTRQNVGENWRLAWNADAVGAFGGAWRAGAYMTIVRTAIDPIGVVTDDEVALRSAAGIHPYAVAHVYIQTTSLPKLSYFGLGPDTTLDAKSTFGMRETIVGSNVIVPITRFGFAQALNLSLTGELNGRFVALRGGPGDEGPSIEHLYSDATAPGLDHQPAFLQMGEGIRMKPSLLNGRVRLNYLFQLQQFIAPSDATNSFRRWTLDLGHELPLYRTSSSPLTRDTNGPNECAMDPVADRCPPISRNRTGTVGVRLLASKSGVSGDSAVPFYFQRTLGGSDLNGNRALASYDDYRFRGPHLVALQETFEHSLYGPIGVWLAAEQGRVALQNEGLGFGDLRKSYGVGVTIRAGGIPAVLISWATGSNEGSHFAFTMSTTLLGGSTRPSLQ
jgi:hypothetical protein